MSGLDLDKNRLKTIDDLNDSLFLPFLQAGKSECFFDEAIPEDTRPAVEDHTSITCNSISELQKTLLEMAKEDEALRDRLEGMARVCGRAKDRRR